MRWDESSTRIIIIKEIENIIIIIITRQTDHYSVLMVKIITENIGNGKRCLSCLNNKSDD